MSIGTLSDSGFHEGSFTLEGYEKGLENTFGKTESHFYANYQECLAKANAVAESAKVYIVNNWEKVNDWSGLNVTVYDRDKEEKVEFYNYDNYEPMALAENSSDIIRNAYERIKERNKEKHNPVESFGEPALDTVDGDFSITINGRQFLWIHNEPIIQIAHYIEYKLKEQEEDGE